MTAKVARHAKYGPGVYTPSSHTRVAHAYMVRQSHLEVSPEVEAYAQSCLLDLHALLRALHWSYWNAHWDVKGENSYASHLLFERFYAGQDEDDSPLIDEIDALAEKIVGYFGCEVLCPIASMQLALNWMQRWGQISCLHQRGLQAEKDLQTSLKFVYEDLKEKGYMPLGLDDFLMATASTHEENIYLLQQSLGGRSKTAFQHPVVVAEANKVGAPLFAEITRSSQSPHLF